MSGTTDGRPVIIGVGQATHNDRDELVTPIDLIERAVRLAEDDGGARVRTETTGLFLSPPWAQDGADAGPAVAGRRRPAHRGAAA